MTSTLPAPEVSSSGPRAFRGGGSQGKGKPPGAGKARLGSGQATPRAARRRQGAARTARARCHRRTIDRRKELSRRVLDEHRQVHRRALERDGHRSPPAWAERPAPSTSPPVHRQSPSFLPLLRLPPSHEHFVGTATWPMTNCSRFLLRASVASTMPSALPRRLALGACLAAVLVCALVDVAEVRARTARLAARAGRAPRSPRALATPRSGAACLAPMETRPRNPWPLKRFMLGNEGCLPCATQRVAPEQMLWIHACMNRARASRPARTRLRWPAASPRGRQTQTQFAVRTLGSGGFLRPPGG